VVLRARGGGRQVSHDVYLSGCGPLSHRSFFGQAQERRRTAKNTAGWLSVTEPCVLLLAYSLRRNWANNTGGHKIKHGY
jgi:hypothetical protein